MLANARQIFNTEAVGTFTYGPVVDGHFVPDLPGVLFANGSFDTSVQILAGQNRREGYLFTDPTLRDDAAIIGQLMKSLGTSQEAAEYVVTTLYPPLYNGSLGYTNWYERVATITTEFAFICNEYYMLSATAQQSNGYLFNYFPGFHGQDIPYTFFNGVVNASNPLEAQNANAAHTLQDWIVSFATGKTPQTHVPGSPNLPLYDGNHQIGALSGAQGLFMAGVVPDPANNLRCQWWQKGLFAHDPAAAS
jgi:carboxylesterase type B